jgi:hypothetical protein
MRITGEMTISKQQEQEMKIDVETKVKEDTALSSNKPSPASKPLKR